MTPLAAKVVEDMTTSYFDKLMFSKANGVSGTSSSRCFLSSGNFCKTDVLIFKSANGLAFLGSKTEVYIGASG